MSTRNPSLQTRSQYQNFWGVYATANVLPNAAGFALVAAKFVLEAGDFAYVTGAGMYQCDSPGTAGGADAVWSAIGSAFATQDRFAPTFLVGNTAAGDSATAYSSAGFNYYPDTGNGAQLAAALAAAVAGGTVYVRRGTYDLGAGGAPASPLTVLAGTIVQGEGSNTTIVRGKSTGNQGVFSLPNGDSSLRDMRVEVLLSDAASLGSDAVIYCASDYADLRNLYVAVSTDAAGQLKEGIRIDGTGGLGRLVSLTNVTINAATTTGSGTPTICLNTVNTDRIVECRNLVTSGGDIGIQGATPLVLWDAQVTAWEVIGLSASGAVPVRCYTSRIEAAPAAPVGAIGALLANTGGIDLSGVSIRTTGISHDCGLRIASAGNIQSAGALRLVTTSGFERGIDLGNTGITSAISDTFVENCVVSASQVGIQVAAQSTGVQVKNNTVTVSGVSGAVLDGIRFESGGVGAMADGNNVTMTDLLNTAYGIRMQCRGTVRQNRVSMTGCLWGIEIDSDDAQCVNNDVIGSTVDGATGAIHATNNARNRITGNLADFQQSTFTSPAMLIEGSLAQVSMNTTVVTADVGGSPGIRLSATSTNCNVLGNICSGSASVAGYIDDLGTTNNLAQNIGT